MNILGISAFYHDSAAALVREKVAKLRELSPLWEMHQEGVDLSKMQWAAH